MVTPNIEDSFDPTKCSRNEEVVLLSSDLPLLGDDIGCRSGELAGGMDREEGDFMPRIQKNVIPILHKF